MNIPQAMTPDDLQTIEDLRRKLDNCREIKGQLRQRCEAAEADVGPMRATIGRLKSEIADKNDAIESYSAVILRVAKAHS